MLHQPQFSHISYGKLTPNVKKLPDKKIHTTDTFYIGQTTLKVLCKKNNHHIF